MRAAGRVGVRLIAGPRPGAAWHTANNRFAPSAPSARVRGHIGKGAAAPARRQLSAPAALKDIDMTPTDLAHQLAHWRQWIGRTEQRRDVITAAPLVGLAATLDRPDPAPQPGEPVAPLAHWLYFLPAARQSELGADGHALRGGFLPPVPLPRRMWAGGRLQFHHPLRVGDEVTRTSTIQQVDAKAGRSGPLVFVTVRHEIANAHGTALSEEHDIVYREAPPAGPAGAAWSAPAPQAAPADADFSRDIAPDPVLLFRYSALTFNGHRIHYDRKHVTEVEGYPGLVVHGPLIATLLVDLLRGERPQAELAHFGFTAVRPLFEPRGFRVCGREEPGGGFALWASDAQGLLAMRAEARVR
jgi:3-methylfumaryl-CoA hydratase